MAVGSEVKDTLPYLGLSGQAGALPIYYYVRAFALTQYKNPHIHGLVLLGCSGTT